MIYFNRFYSALLQYKEEHGDLLIPRRYVINGYRLGRVVGNVRAGMINVTEDEHAILSHIGFVWKIRESPKRLSFSEFYRCLIEYQKQTGNVRVPYYYQTESGINLGVIASNIRNGNRKLTDFQKQKLIEIGFVIY